MRLKFGHLSYSCFLGSSSLWVILVWARGQLHLVLLRDTVVGMSCSGRVVYRICAVRHLSSDNKYDNRRYSEEALARSGEGKIAICR